MAAPEHKVAIACQGGGSHTAFTAGVLKRLLSERARLDAGGYRITALSGTSGGAICALLAWYGLVQDDWPGGVRTVTEGTSTIEHDLDAVPVALALCRADGGIIAANRAWCELMKVDAEAATGRGWLGLVGPRDRPPLLIAIDEAARGVPVHGDGQVPVEVGGRMTLWRPLAGDSDTPVVITVVEAPVSVPASAPRSRAVRGPSPSSDGATGLSEQALGELIHDIYAASLTVASYAGLYDEPAGGPMHRAVDDLDRVIGDIRSAAAWRWTADQS